MTTGATVRPETTFPPTPASTDAIGAWLDRLLRLTRLPAPDAAELRDELDAHLRERVRDLMLAGNDEPDAIHKSISELGDLALLAQRYREASRTPRRRLTMNIALIAAAGAALGLSTLALRQGQPESPPAGALSIESLAPGAYRLGLVPEDVGPDGQGTYRLGLVPEGAGPLVPTLADLPIAGFFSTSPSPSVAVGADVDAAPLSQVLSMLAESQGLKPYIHWRDLDAEPQAGLPDLPLADQPLDRAFDMLNDALDLDGDAVLTYRTAGGLFEVASRGYFDRRERELATYEVSGLVYAEGPLQTTQESAVLVQLITEILEPEVWIQNGGEIGSISCVGGKLFVNAPPRVHERLAWLLTQLQDEQAHSADDARSVTSYALSHTAADEILPILDDAVRALGGQAQLNARSNSLLVIGTDEAQAIARAVVNALDRPAAEPGSHGGDPAPGSPQ